MQCKRVIAATIEESVQAKRHEIQLPPALPAAEIGEPQRNATARAILRIDVRAGMAAIDAHILRIAIIDIDDVIDRIALMQEVNLAAVELDHGQVYRRPPVAVAPIVKISQRRHRSPARQQMCHLLPP